MSQNEPGLLEEFSEVVAAARSLIEADVARGVRGYERLSSAQVKSLLEETTRSSESQVRAASPLVESTEGQSAEAGAGSFGSENPEGAVLVWEGPKRAEIVVVGGVCGVDESEAGRPFLGEGGDMLEKMLKHVLGVEKREVVLVMAAGVVSPKSYADAVAKLLASVEPRLILGMGKVAVSALHSEGDAASRELGQWRNFHGVPMMATLDPEHLLDHPTDKRKVFAHLKSFRLKMGTMGVS